MTIRPLAALGLIMLCLPVPGAAQRRPGLPGDSLPYRRPDSLPPLATAPGPGDSLTPVLAGSDPIGTLLENRDSLHLTPELRQRLVQLNLRLFRRNRAVQLRIDSLVPPPPDPPARAERPSPAVQEQLAPLYARLRAQIAAARDTALEMLTPEQRDIVARLEQRERERRPGRGRDRPPR